MPINGAEVFELVAKKATRRHPRSRTTEKFVADVKAHQEKLLSKCPVVDGSRKVLVVEEKDSRKTMTLFGQVVLEINSDGIMTVMLGVSPSRIFAMPARDKTSGYHEYVAMKSVVGNLKGFTAAVAAQARRMLDKTAARFADEAATGRAHGTYQERYNQAVRFMRGNDLRNLPRVVVFVCIMSGLTPSELRNELGPRRWRWLLKQKGAYKWLMDLVNPRGTERFDLLKACADIGVSRPMSVKSLRVILERHTLEEYETILPNFYKMAQTAIRDLERHKNTKVLIRDKASATNHIFDIALRHVRNGGDVPLERQALESMASITRWINQEEARQRVLDAQRLEAWRARHAQREEKLGPVLTEWGNYFEPVQGVDGYTMKEITTHLDLLEEGVEMNHCVAGYHDRAARGETHIFTVRGVNPKDRATMEVWREDGGLSINQLHTYCNGRPSAELEVAARKMFKSLKLRVFALARAC